MPKLGERFTEFSRIDLDTRGGYARVAQVRANKDLRYPEHCAFKIMRHEIDPQKGVERFEDEIELLSIITSDKNAPSAVTRIYECGFVDPTLSKSLHSRGKIDNNLEIIPTGRNIEDFRAKKDLLKAGESGGWLPYIVVELAPYDNNMLRQILNQPEEDPAGLFRLPTGEVIILALQLLDVMNYLHENHSRAYIDWKPEHIFWDGVTNQVKLIDWNVTTRLDDDPGRKQNIKDDLRLFCGAVLYIGLTFIDPDTPTQATHSIGPRPTTDLNSPVPEIRRRYWTDKPVFHQRNATLDDNIKELIRKGLDPNAGFDSIQKLRNALLDYAKTELGIAEGELTFKVPPVSPYFKSLIELRTAQKGLLTAQGHLMEAVGTHGQSTEFLRLFNAIKRALKNFPIS